MRQNRSFTSRCTTTSTISTGNEALAHRRSSHRSVVALVSMGPCSPPPQSRPGKGSTGTSTARSSFCCTRSRGNNHIIPTSSEERGMPRAHMRRTRRASACCVGRAPRSYGTLKNCFLQPPASIQTPTRHLRILPPASPRRHATQQLDFLPRSRLLAAKNGVDLRPWARPLTPPSR